MNVALTGASGFVGSSVCRRLAEAGHAVTGLVRPSSTRSHIDPFVSRYAVGDHADPSIWDSLLEGADAVIHNSLSRVAFDREKPLEEHLRSNLLGSIGLLEAAHRRGVRRFVFVSSVATIHEVSPRWEGVIDADHPLRPGGWYGAYKAAVEAQLWAARHAWGMHTAAVRPAGIYGVEPVHLERSHAYEQVRRLLAGEKVTRVDFPGGGKWVHIEDVALALVRAVERDEANGGIFHLADCYAKRTRFGEHAAAILGLDPSMVEPDDGPPAKNRFSKAETKEVLDVGCDRGDDGLRAYVAELIEAVRRAG